MEKNESITAVCEGIGNDGEGIFRHEGITFFVPYCIFGERVRFRVLKVKGNVGYGKVEEILSPSKDRVFPKCPVFGKCGGCQLQHLDYTAQLSVKKQSVEKSLKKIGGIDAELSSVVPCDFPYEYRNKLQIPVGTDPNGNAVVGFYANRSHRIVPVEDCPIHPKWAGEWIAVLKKYLSECGMRAYDEEKKTGEVRHFVVREIDGKFILTLVVACGIEKVKNVSRLVELLKETGKEFTLYLNENGKDTNVIFGEKFLLASGSGFFDGEEEGICFSAGAQTFVQVNKNVRKKLYADVLKKTIETGDEVIVDAYSGGGLLTAMLAKRCKRAYGIEIEKEAVACADELKKKNGLKNIRNLCGKVEDELPALLEREKGEKVRLVLDPPRAGIARSVVYALKKSGIEKLVLVSCNPSTLARDLGLLTGSLKETETGELKKTECADGEYQIESICAYDMFPQTKHVETLVCLARKTI